MIQIVFVLLLVCIPSTVQLMFVSEMLMFSAIVRNLSLLLLKFSGSFSGSLKIWILKIELTLSSSFADVIVLALALIYVLI